MDPINAITGIRKSAREVSGILGPYVTAIKKLGLGIVSEAVQVHSNVQTTKLLLAALQGLLQNLSSFPAAQNTTLIKVDHLVAILTNGVIVFSKLETIISSIRPFDAAIYTTGRANTQIQVEILILQDLRWPENQPAFESVLSGLEGFKTSLFLMVNILQADTNQEGAKYVQELEKRVSMVLHDNPSLSFYLASDDDRKMSQSRTTLSQPTEAGPSRQPQQQPFGAFQSTLRSLLSRRPQQRSTPSTTDLPSSSSPFAGLTLSEISSPSVITIPVQKSDVSNPQHYVFINTTSSPSSSSKQPPPSHEPTRSEAEFTNIPRNQPDKYIYHDCLLIKAQLEQVPRLKRFLEYPWSLLPSPDSSNTPSSGSHSRVLTEMHLLRRLLRSGGVHVIGQMVQKINHTDQSQSQTQSQLNGNESKLDFQTWLKNPVPIYTRTNRSKSDRSNNLELEKEVNLFTIVCLGFRDLGDVINVRGSTSWLFRTRDLVQDDYGGFVKVIGVIKTVLDRLTRRGMLESVDRMAILSNGDHEMRLDEKEKGKENEKRNWVEVEEVRELEYLPEEDPPAYESGDEGKYGDVEEKTGSLGDEKKSYMSV